MSLLLASVVDVAILLALSLIAVAVLSRRSAALRHAMLAAGILAAVLVPAFEYLMPPVAIVRWGSEAPAVSAAGELTLNATDLVVVPVMNAVPSPAFPWARLVVAVWVAGVAVTLGGLVLGLVRLRRLTSRCAEVRDGPWRAALDAQADALSLRRRVTLLQSAEPSMLLTCGTLRPKIVLPSDADTWSAERIGVVLAHELAHVRRCDGALLLAGEVLRAVHWFNPLVWLACRQLREQSEFACDDAVLLRGVTATDYAGHLLDIARLTTARYPRVAPAIAHSSALERRFAAMLNERRHREPLTRRGAVRAALAAAVVAVPLAAAGIAGDTPPTFAPAPIVGDVVLASSPMPAMVPELPRTQGVRSVPARTAGDATEGMLPVNRERASGASAAAAVPAAAAAPPPAMLPAAAAQLPGTLSGVVMDQTGGVLPGVTLNVTGADGTTRTVVSDTNGRFLLRDVPPGDYAVVGSLAAFGSVISTTKVGPGDSAMRVMTLPLGTLEERITVVCGAAQAQQRAVGLFRRVRSAMFPVLHAQDLPLRLQPVRVGGNVRVSRKLAHVTPQCAEVPLPGTIVQAVGRIGVDGAMRAVRHVTPPTGTPAPPTALVDATLDAIHQWNFTPTLLNGVPTEVALVVNVIYQ